MSSKITIIGAGNVGSTIAYTLAHDDIASELVMIDVNKDKVEGESDEAEEEEVLSESEQAIIWTIPDIISHIGGDEQKDERI